jgi:hypothetical protein
MSHLTALYFGYAGLWPAARRRALRHFICLFAASAGNAHGSVSCGVGLLRRDGKYLSARAAASPAAFYPRRDFQRILAAVDDNAVAILGYAGENADADARAASAQPVQWQTTVGLCDASLTNAEALTLDLGWAPEAPPPEGLLLRLVNEAYAADAGTSLSRAVAVRLRLAEGPFALVAWDRRFPETLIAARAGGGLFAFADGVTGAVHFSSRPALAETLFGDYSSLPVLPENTLRCFDPSYTFEPETAALFPPGQPTSRGAAKDRTGIQNVRCTK